MSMKGPSNLQIFGKDPDIAIVATQEDVIRARTDRADFITLVLSVIVHKGPKT